MLYTIRKDRLMSLNTTESMPSQNREAESQSTGDPPRRVSIDVFRGMVMFLMLVELMHLFDLADAFPGVPAIGWLQFHTSHVAWAGCSLHDLIQPAFTFLVGVSMPFSIASRMRRGSGVAKLLLHAAWRSVILVSLGIVLRSLDRDTTYFTFEDTLTQIGLGYFLVFLIALAPRWVHYASAAAILVGFWLAFALSPPPVDFDYPAVGVPADWPHHYEGLASSWNKNSNLAWKTDVWFMNLFPRETPFEFNEGGYSTLSFVPTAVTMILGLIVGTWMRDLSGKPLYLRMLGLTLIGVSAGVILDQTGICPLVKRIWTPSFTLYSGGLCAGWLLIICFVCDVRQWTKWGFPFVVIGANSILIYVMSWTIAEPIRDLLLRHFGEAPFAIFGPSFVLVFSGAATLAILFYILLWMYRHRAFVKI
jgi:predicted acyltransferase